VEDQGVGIPPDYQQAVFDRFESRSHGSRHRGAGLGLSIVKSLAELHGGAVRLDSAQGQGTRVTVLLPLQQVPAKSTPEAEEPLYQSSRAG
jgi:signal transduction histidine kinase